MAGLCWSIVEDYGVEAFDKGESWQRDRKSWWSSECNSCHRQVEESCMASWVHREYQRQIAWVAMMTA